jgi:hypothetical protein
MYSCREGQDARERREDMDVPMPRRAGCPRAARRSGMAGSGTMPPRSDAASGRLWFPPGIRAIGLMAEWSCSGLQSRVRRFDSDSGLHLVAEDRAPARLPRKRPRQSRASFSVSSASLRRRRHIPVPGSRVIVRLRKIGLLRRSCCGSSGSCVDPVAEDRAPARLPRKRSRQSRASFSVSFASLRRRRHILVPGTRAFVMARRCGLLPRFRCGRSGHCEVGRAFPSPSGKRRPKGG